MARNPVFNRLLKDVENQIASEYPNIFGEVHQEVYLKDSKAITKAMLETYEAKDTDYASNGRPMGNLRRSERVGIQPWKAVLLRMSDKQSRIESFISKGNYQVEDEKVTDTLIDFANYSLLGCCLYLEWVEEYKTLYSEDARKEEEQDWVALAAWCVRTKLVYDYGQNPDNQVTEWHEGPWHSAVNNFDTLCQKACNASW